MSKQKLDRRIVFGAAAAMLGIAVLGLVGYNSYQRKQVNEIVAHRAWQLNREMGVPLSMEAGANATPEEREQARRFAQEQMQWQGKSEVETLDTISTPTP